MESQQQELDLGRYLQVLYKRRYLYITVAAVLITISTAASFVMPEIYEASSTVSIEKNYLNLLMRDIAVTSSMEQQVQALSIVMTSRGMLARTLADLAINMEAKTDIEIEGLIKYFQKSTQIKFDLGRANRRDMDIFTVTYRDRDPRFARDYVNALVNRYVVDSISTKRAEALGANRFIYEQMELYKKKIDQTEKELELVRRQRGEETSARLLALQRKYEDLLVQYTDKHPEVARLKAEIESTRQQIREREAATVPAKAADSKAARTQGGRDNGKSIADLERDREAYKKVYESLVASLGRSEVSAQVEVQAKADTFNILEPAVLPIRPVSKPRWTILVLGIAAGIFGGAVAVIILDRTDRTVRDIHTLKELGLQVIGVIPRIESAEAVIAARKTDIAVYAIAGLYLIGITAFAFVEHMK